MAEIYAEAMSAYRNMEWTKAVDLFDRVLKINPNDMPSKVIRKRCNAYKNNPPDEFWDGSYFMLTK